METKDYIYLYAGIDILICEPEIEPVPAILEGFDHHQKKVIAERVSYDPSWIVPLLRPLSDLKHSEINDIASIILKKETACGKIEWTPEKDFLIATWKIEESENPHYDFVEMGMHISNIGSPFKIDHVWNYIKTNKNQSTSHEPLHNSHEITRYLLLKQFDIFGLIEAGIAKTIETQKL